VQQKKRPGRFFRDALSRNLRDVIKP